MFLFQLLRPMTEATLPTETAPATGEDDYDLETLFQPPIDIFHPLGDVVLHVVDDKNLESRFQVSTDMLAQACPFFDKLLNGDFAEGQKNDRNGSDKREVQIRENRTVVQILCCVIHHKKLEDEMKLSPSVVLQYAILVDKY
ncbi:hypothetical protein M409DRAFT_24049 [Zasmidium cellare ATCC 36951]|uniref:BTB domain-containing protein n=1 Tax=Zasmidium cellare ATCC 36951 TaxID=1080233 RepID=A0A6A6CGI8_ZASCE|nr:uncharacterized protein M409DRAFT_24049 [Zasmidium cellare ATCC 36951]KAF2165763.1 hypothetical protein M409DRAFT_24049 [Zasmidium cellare ATCC 36951]